jgi:hypothetical protein
MVVWSCLLIHHTSPERGYRWYTVLPKYLADGNPRENLRRRCSGQAPPIARPPSARRAPWRARSPLEDGEVLRVTAFGNIIPVLAADITWRGASGTVIGEEGAYPSQSKTGL